MARGRALIIDRDPDRGLELASSLRLDGLELVTVKLSTSAAKDLGPAIDVALIDRGQAPSLMEKVSSDCLPCGIVVVASEIDDWARRAVALSRVVGLVRWPDQRGQVCRLARLAADLARLRREVLVQAFVDVFVRHGVSRDDDRGGDLGDVFLGGAAALFVQMGDLEGQTARAMTLRTRGIDNETARKQMGRISRSTHNKHVAAALEAVGAEGPHDLFRAIAVWLSIKQRGDDANQGAKES